MWTAPFNTRAKQNATPPRQTLSNDNVNRVDLRVIGGVDGACANQYRHEVVAKRY